MEWEQWGDQVRAQLDEQRELNNELEEGVVADSDPVPSYNRGEYSTPERVVEVVIEPPMEVEDEPQRGPEEGQEARRERLRLRLVVLRALVAEVPQRELKELLQESVTALENDL